MWHNSVGWVLIIVYFFAWWAKYIKKRILWGQHTKQKFIKLEVNIQDKRGSAKLKKVLFKHLYFKLF